QIALYEIQIAVILSKHMRHQAFVEIYGHLVFQLWEIQVKGKRFIGWFRILPEALLRTEEFAKRRQGAITHRQTHTEQYDQCYGDATGYKERDYSHKDKNNKSG